MKSTDKLVQIAQTMSAKPHEFKVGDLVVCAAGMTNTHQIQYGVVYAVVDPVLQPNMSYEPHRGFRPRGGLSFNPHDDRTLVPTVVLAAFEPDHHPHHANAATSVFVTDAYRVRMATLTDVNRYDRHIQRLMDLEEEKQRLITEFRNATTPFQDSELDDHRPTTTL